MTGLSSLSVCSRWYGALFITATSLLPFAKLPWPIALSRANSSYIARTSYGDTRVLTCARTYTRHRDGLNTMNNTRVPRVSRPCVSLCVCVHTPLTCASRSIRLRKCVRTWHVYAYMQHEYVFHTRELSICAASQALPFAVYEAVF